MKLRTKNDELRMEMIDEYKNELVNDMQAK